MKAEHSSNFAGPDTLEDQAGLAAAHHLFDAVRNIDGSFEPGYAAKHPELVAAFMQVSATNFAMYMIAKAIMYHGEKIGDAINSIDEIADAFQRENGGSHERRTEE
jgi:hypothetical protein